MTPEMLDKAFNKIRKAIRCLFCDFLKLKGLVDTYYPCIGYRLEIIRGSGQFEYIDCSGVLQNIILTGGVYHICARKGTVVKIDGNGSISEDVPSAPCPTPPCKDYVVTGVGPDNFQISFFDCNREYTELEIHIGECITIQALDGTITAGSGLDVQEGTECPTTTTSTTTTTTTICHLYTVTNNGVVPFNVSFSSAPCIGEASAAITVNPGQTSIPFCAAEGSITFDVVVPNSINILGPCI